MKSYNGPIALVLLVLCSLAAVMTRSPARPSEAKSPAATPGGALAECKRLQASFPTLEEFQVRAFRNQDWCKNILYAGGAFTESTHPSTCDLFQEAALPFTEEAREVHGTIADELAQTGVGIHWLSLAFDEAGQVEHAEFALSGFARRSYVYHPEGQRPEGLGREIVIKPLDGNWSLRLEDWN